MTNFFKVIYIKSTREVEPVPHRWEVDGIVYWPPTKGLVRQLQSNAGSIPDTYTWKKYDCVVKASNILLYMHASAQADQICAIEESSDQTTDDERGRAGSSVKPQLNYSKRTVVVKNKKIPTSTYNFNSPESEGEKRGQIGMRQSNITESTLGDSESQINQIILQTMSTLSSKVDALSQTLQENEEKMTQKSAEISVRLDRLYDLIKKSESSTMLNDEEVDIFPIDSMEDLQLLENDLSENGFKNKLFAHLTRSVGSAMPHKPACYKLASVMFTKQLLTNYSWTGMSGTFEKKPFNKLTRILDLFFKVIYKSDNSFTYPARDSFFRDCILKHSNTRLRLSKKNMPVLTEGNAYGLDDNYGVYTIEENGDLRKDDLL